MSLGVLLRHFSAKMFARHNLLLIQVLPKNTLQMKKYSSLQNFLEKLYAIEQRNITVSLLVTHR